MTILDRIRVAFLRRELAALKSADRASRNAAQTTHDMMIQIIEDTTRIVELENRIRALEGVEDDEFEDDESTQRIPSSLFIPSKDPPS